MTKDREAGELYDAIVSMLENDHGSDLASKVAKAARDAFTKETPSPEERVKARVLEYVAAVQRMENEHIGRDYPNLKPEVITVQFGKRYAKIIRGGGSAHSFVALTDIHNKQVDAKVGDILKPASWKTPARHARGSVFNADITRGVDHYGPRYLR